MIVRPEHFEFDRDRARDNERAAHDPALTDNQRGIIGDAGDVQPFFTEAASHCFYCGEKLTIPAIMWNGRSCDGKDAAEVWLHPNCAEVFCARISRDAEELRLGKERAKENFRRRTGQQTD